MLRELDRVVLRHEHSLGSRIMLWLYPNRGWKGDSPGAGEEHAAGVARAAQAGPARRKETAHAV